MTYANIEITFLKFVEFLCFLSFVGTWNTKVQKSKEMRGTNPGNPLLSSIVWGTIMPFDWSVEVATGSVLFLSRIQLRVSAFVYLLVLSALNDPSVRSFIFEAMKF